MFRSPAAVARGLCAAAGLVQMGLCAPVPAEEIFAPPYGNPSVASVRPANFAVAADEEAALSEGVAKSITTGGCQCSKCQCGCGAAACPSAEASASEVLFGGPLRERPKLSGDWFGLRPALAERGILFDLYASQFYQGVAAGGGEQEWEYGGKLDFLIHADAGKLGIQEGLFLDLHGESRLGQAVNNIDGLIAPSNLAMNFPESEGNLTALTGVKVTQALSENFAFFGGKLNTLDEYPLHFTRALGLERPGLGGFMNTSLVFNPIMARTIPYSAAAVGAAVIREGEPIFTLTAFDPQERATIGFEDLYARGVVIVPDFIFRVAPFGLPGTYNFGGSYSNAKYRSVDPAAYLVLPTGGIAAGQETGSWCLYSNIYQSLWTDGDDRSWGVFGQFGVSDGDPNPVRGVSNFGVVARGLAPARPRDTMGAGFFYLGLSRDFKNLASAVVPQQNELGTEFFYNLEVARSCRLTADLQVANPSTRAFDTVVIPGVRLVADF